MRSLDTLKEKLYRLLNSKKRDKNWQNIIKTFGRPGIWYYVKKDYYEQAVKHLVTELNQFHDLEKTQGRIIEIVFQDFEFKNEITKCDYSHELFKETDVLIQLWAVNKNI